MVNEIRVSVNVANGLDQSLRVRFIYTPEAIRDCGRADQERGRGLLLVPGPALSSGMASRLTGA
jgi:hypothetical protein